MQNVTTKSNAEAANISAAANQSNNSGNADPQPAANNAASVPYVRQKKKRVRHEVNSEIGEQKGVLILSFSFQPCLHLFHASS